MADLDDLDTLANLARRIEPIASVRRWYRWEERRDSTGFPERRKQVGHYAFYSEAEVVEWYTLWLRATANMRGKHAALNGKARSDQPSE